MSQNSQIEWTHHTFNPWRGCTKVSPGCAFCYAERDSKRFPKIRGIWGKNGTRVIASEAMWKEPRKWDRLAAEAGERHRVFCASLADVFEGNDTMPEAAHELVRQARIRLFQLIEETPNLNWLLLTKRPENIKSILDDISNGNGGLLNLAKHLPNVWLGTSVEDQKAADDRIPHLLSVPVAVRFLSCEPLLGKVNLRFPSAIRDDVAPTYPEKFGEWSEEAQRRWAESQARALLLARERMQLHWVIVGGESGHAARPMHPNWVRSLRDQCSAAGVSFFFKQWGEWSPRECVEETRLEGPTLKYFPDINMTFSRVGKKNAGRWLDGCEWDELPTIN